MNVMKMGTAIAITIILGTAILIGALLEAIAPVLIIVVAAVVIFSIAFTVILLLLSKK